MDLSRLRSRRGVLATALVAALSRVMPASAQMNGDCQYTFINGLLTVGGDNCGIAVPGHMVDATSNSLNDNDGVVNSNVDSPNEIRQDRLYDRRNRRRNVRSRRTNQKQTQRDRRHERKILCEDFSNQFDAVEAMAQNPWAAKKLDPDGDGIPCEDLRPLTCDEFVDEAEAVKWFQRMGYSKDYDPFKLYDAETSSVCTFRATCDDFSSQKAAVEWLTDNPKDAAKLDPDGDGAPCANLSPVTCKAFTTQDEAKQWFNRNGFTAAKDPYKLIDPDLNEVCPKRGTCDDFTSQKQAVEWLTDHPVDRPKLDPDNDWAPCQKLPTVTCKAFGTIEEAKTWFNTNGFTPAKDPYNLYHANTASVCPELMCSRFTTQKAAIEWMKNHPDDKPFLDPNGDGLACTHLTPVKCNQFSSSTEVLKWHEQHNIQNDPYGLFDQYANPQRYCSKLPLTANG